MQNVLTKNVPLKRTSVNTELKKGRRFFKKSSSFFCCKVAYSVEVQEQLLSVTDFYM